MTINKQQQQILIIDDDARILELLSQYLSQHNFAITKAENASKALEFLQKNIFDLIIMDIMMPVKNGIELTKEIRQTKKLNTPILILSALIETKEKIQGLQAGADDYLIKPFDPEELLLRIQAILRRNIGKNNDEEIKLSENISLNIKKRLLHKNNKIISLTHKETAILTLFFQQQNQIISREQLSQIDFMVNQRTIDVQITRLRRKLEEDPANPQFLITIRGSGYKLQAK